MNPMQLDQLNSSRSTSLTQWCIYLKLVGSISELSFLLTEQRSDYGVTALASRICCLLVIQPTNHTTACSTKQVEELTISPVVDYSSLDDIPEMAICKNSHKKILFSVLSNLFHCNHSKRIKISSCQQRVFDITQLISQNEWQFLRI